MVIKKKKVAVWQATSFWIVISVAVVLFLIVVALIQNPEAIRTTAVPPTNSPQMGVCYANFPEESVFPHRAADGCRELTEGECSELGKCSAWIPDEYGDGCPEIARTTEDEATAVCGGDLDTFDAAERTCARKLLDVSCPEGFTVDIETEPDYYGETLSPTTTPYQCTVGCCLGYRCVPTIESTAPIT